VSVTRSGSDAVVNCRQTGVSRTGRALDRDRVRSDELITSRMLVLMKTPISTDRSNSYSALQCEKNLQLFLLRDSCRLPFSAERSCPCPCIICVPPPVHNSTSSFMSH